MSFPTFTNVGPLWREVYHFLRRHGCHHHQAEDLTQDVFLAIARQGGFDHRNEEASSNDTQTRNYVFKAARNTLIDRERKAKALKRGGGRRTVSYDDPSAPSETLLDEDSPAKVVQWREARQHLEHHLSRLRDEVAEEGKATVFEEISGYLIPGRQEASYADSARALGVSPVSLRVQAHRWRKQLLSRVRAEFETLGAAA